MNTRLTVIAFFSLVFTVEQAQSSPSFSSHEAAFKCFEDNPAKSDDKIISDCLAAINSGTMNRQTMSGALTNLATAFMHKKDWDNAIQTLTVAVRVSKSDWRPLVDRAAAYSQIGKTDLALDDLKASLSLTPTWQAYINRADIYAQLGKDDLCLNDYESAIKLAPNEPVVYRARAEFYAQKNKFGLAIADFTNALRVQPTDAKAMYLRGEAKEKNGDTAGGELDLTNARKIDPDADRRYGN